MPQIGPLLADLLTRAADDEHEELGFLATASVAGTSRFMVKREFAVDHFRAVMRPRGAPTRTRHHDAPAVAVTALVNRTGLNAARESWKAYREITLRQLGAVATRLSKMDIEATPMIASAGLQFTAAPDQLRWLGESGPKDLQFLELDPVIHAELLDDVPNEVELPAFRLKHPDLDGSGVGVAVLDSGIDGEHPFLDVAEAVSTCGEDVALPGLHGTHCAGIIASQDTEFRGIAPGIRLIDVKVGRANGGFRAQQISLGFDRALNDHDVDVISVSLGLNHLPLTSLNGHGWHCPRELCLLCRAVDLAIRGGKVVVAAAGNEHERANALRADGHGSLFDTELCCPGQFKGALTVGSVQKRTRQPASNSSHGPSSFGAVKPDLAAPGVNVTSTIPAPRDAGGKLVPNPDRSELFTRKSGTSMATPAVAGLAALMIQRLRAAGKTPTPAGVKRALRTGALDLGLGPDIAGNGLVRAR
jgi:hypothetical protein